MRLKFTTLKKRSDFVRGNESSFRMVSHTLIVQGLRHCLPSEKEAVNYFPLDKASPSTPSLVPTIQCGFTVSKRIGKAVIRNKIRRRLKALARDIVPELPYLGYDYIFIARAGVTKVTYQALEKEMRWALGKLSGIISQKLNDDSQP